MISDKEIFETMGMVSSQHLDVRCITMGISLFDCITDDADKTATRVYDKIASYAKDLVSVGDKIATMYGVPVVNKRVSVTPVSLIGAASGGYQKIALAMDRAAAETGIDFIGGRMRPAIAAVLIADLFAVMTFLNGSSVLIETTMDLRPLNTRSDRTMNSRRIHPVSVPLEKTVWLMATGQNAMKTAAAKPAFFVPRISSPR